MENTNYNKFHVDIFCDDRPDKEYIIRSISQLIDEMPNHKVEDYFLAKPEVALDMQWVLFLFDNKTNKCNGFLCAKMINVAERKCLMLYTILMAERLHGNMATFIILQRLFKELHESVGDELDCILLKTANPRSFKIIHSFSSIEDASFYPNHNTEGYDDSGLSNFAEKLADYLHPDSDFDKRTGVIYGAGGAVPSDFYSGTPQCRDDSINLFFKENISTSDRVICILNLPTSDAKNTLYKRFRV